MRGEHMERSSGKIGWRINGIKMHGIHLWKSQKQKERLYWGGKDWRDGGWAVKNTCCSCRSPGGSSLHSCLATQPYITVAPGDLIPSSGLHRHKACTSTHADTMPKYIIIIITTTTSLNNISPTWERDTEFEGNAESLSSLLPKQSQPREQNQGPCQVLRAPIQTPPHPLFSRLWKVLWLYLFLCHCSWTMLTGAAAEPGA